MVVISQIEIEGHVAAADKKEEMAAPENAKAGDVGEDFARRAGESQPGLFREFWDFLRSNKKWWLLPILVVLLLVGCLLFFGGTVAAPFIYTLF